MDNYSETHLLQPEFLAFIKTTYPKHFAVLTEPSDRRPLALKFLLQRTYDHFKDQTKKLDPRCGLIWLSQISGSVLHFNDIPLTSLYPETEP